jgi:hypothetical protein
VLRFAGIAIRSEVLITLVSSEYSRTNWTPVFNSPMERLLVPKGLRDIFSQGHLGDHWPQPFGLHRPVDPGTHSGAPGPNLPLKQIDVDF